MDKRVAEAVLERAAAHCEACGWPGAPLVLHHRRLRKHQGPDTTGNLIAVHPRCHVIIHANADGLSYQLGHLVSQFDDETSIPVQVRLRR